MRFSSDAPRGGTENMALDVAMLVAAEGGEASARTYSWNEAWVSLGMNQTRASALLNTCIVPSVSRPTGGKAVLHGHDLTIAIAIPLDQLATSRAPSLPRSVRTIYRIVVQPIINALTKSHQATCLGEVLGYDGSGTSSDCFASAAPNDVVLEGTGGKICGVAIRLTERAVLVQASIPTSPPRVHPATVFESPAEAHYIALDRSSFDAVLFEELTRLTKEQVPC